MNGRRWVALAALGLAASGLSIPAQAEPVVVPAAAYDFNGDGFPELATGVPGLRVGSAKQAGGVVVLPASAAGLSTSETIITQSTGGVPGASEKNDAFGYAITSADFDADGYADLAIGAPGENGGAGAVTIVYGSATGLAPGTRSVGYTIPDSGALGFSLAAADLTGDGYADLAMGSPDEDYTDLGDGYDYGPSGVVHVYRGSATGLSATGALVERRSAGTNNENFDVGFGAKLAAGDLDGDAELDLVVGSDGDRFVDEGYAGSISVCPGSTLGSAGCVQSQHLAKLANMSDLAIGKVTGSTRPDIVVGSPLYNEEDTGRVLVMKVSSTDPTSVAAPIEITQASPGVPGAAGIDAFGAGLALGDIDKDGYADMATGAPREDGDRGRVTIVRGGPDGYATTGNFGLDQSSPGVPGASESGDSFGAAVSLVDHNQDTFLDLSVGQPGEDGDNGAITLLRGAGTGFATTGNKGATLSSLGYKYPTNAFFGETFGTR